MKSYPNRVELAAELYFDYYASSGAFMSLHITYQISKSMLESLTFVWHGVCYGFVC